MKEPLGLIICVALTVVMLWAAPSLAQGRGKGQVGQSGQTYRQGQGQGQGQGAGYGNGPNFQGKQYCRGNWGNNPQGNGGRRGYQGGRNNQPNPPANVPPVSP